MSAKWHHEQTQIKSHALLQERHLKEDKSTFYFERIMDMRSRKAGEAVPHLASRGVKGTKLSATAVDDDNKNKISIICPLIYDFGVVPNVFWSPSLSKSQKFFVSYNGGERMKHRWALPPFRLRSQSLTGLSACKLVSLLSRVHHWVSVRGTKNKTKHHGQRLVDTSDPGNVRIRFLS